MTAAERPLDMIAYAHSVCGIPRRNETGYACAECGAEMNPERDDCRPCPRCKRDHWRFGADNFGTGVFAPDGVQESHHAEYAKCLGCGYVCDPEDLEVTDDSACPRCYHVGAPVDLRQDAREQAEESRGEE